ncbi:MAG: hypothetical protein ACXWQO_08270 [Bdellovibrionota bacterium]
MRNSIGAKKDFMELSFISALFLGLAPISACSSIVKDSKAFSETKSAYAETYKGGKNEFRN